MKAGAGQRVLLVVAAPREARCVREVFGVTGASVAWRVVELDGRFDLVESGVGKVNAACACVRAIDPARHGGALSVGVCGSLPGGPGVGAAVVASVSVYGDEGLVTPTGFTDCAAMGFEPVPGVGVRFEPDAAWAAAMGRWSDLSAPIATVSTCSGTDAAAAAVAARTGAACEAMEGAAVAHALARLGGGLRFGEVRTVSNTTGDRARQRWELEGALARLGEVLGRMRVEGLPLGG